MMHGKNEPPKLTRRMKHDKLKAKITLIYVIYLLYYIYPSRVELYRNVGWLSTLEMQPTHYL